MLYVYAILDNPGGHAADDELPAARGVAGQAIRFRAAGPVVAAYGELPGGAPAPTAPNVLRHEEVVEMCMNGAEAVLPARFGTVFGSSEGLTAVLERNAERLSRGLAKVRGCV